MLAMGWTSGACGLDWALVEVPGNSDLLDASDERQTDSDGGLIGPPRKCSRTQPCYYDEYCDYPDPTCGNGGDGICRLRPEACTQTGPAQCGCDGKRYTMACEAHRAGIDDGPDACASNAPTYFACGTRQCRVGTEYCLVTGLLVGRNYDCKSFNGCDAQNCSCASVQVCLGTCAEVTGGGTLRDCSL